MSTCQVLRCENPINHVHVWGPNPWGRIEFGICNEHKERIQNGEEWAIHNERGHHYANYLVMGDDLAGTGDNFVTRITSNQVMGHLTPKGENALKITLETQRRGSEQHDYVEFCLSPKMAAGMADMLASFASHNSPKDGAGEEQPSD
ncbi:hypothetical protein [Actinomadura luteofluorescens]|uniref:hypothetical protein n=1 Tax=Actinomadura luteofluorescens TaxID=46163 RepID=UPI003D8DB4C2